MGTIECSQPAFKSSWDSQDFGGISMVLKMAHFRKSTWPRWVKLCSLNIPTESLTVYTNDALIILYTSYAHFNQMGHPNDH